MDAIDIGPTITRINGNANSSFYAKAVKENHQNHRNISHEKRGVPASKFDLSYCTAAGSLIRLELFCTSLRLDVVRRLK
jgi:6-phosphofructokinase